MIQISPLTSITKYSPILAIAVVELASGWPYASDAMGVAMAMLGGGMMQIRRAEKKKLTTRLIIAEWVLCGLAGFATHAIVSTQLESTRMVLTACIFSGCLGSEGLFKESQRRARNRDNGK